MRKSWGLVLGRQKVSNVANRIPTHGDETQPVHAKRGTRKCWCFGVVRLLVFDSEEFGRDADWMLTIVL